jgi:type II secretory pathway pseudopilin PulG
MYRSKRQSSGFTLIELMLAMAFLAFILMFMALTLVQMLRTYDKGLTIKQVNQAGRTLTDDIAKSLRGEKPGDIILTNVPNGRLCIGNVMYIWNPVYIGTRTAPAPNQTPDDYNFSGPAAPITMARQYLANPTATCSAANLVNYTVPHNQENYSLLGDRARVLWAGVTPSADGRLVELSFVLGTYDTTERDLIKASTYTSVFNTPTFAAGQPICKSGSDGNYCAFAEFSTIVYLPNGE